MANKHRLDHPTFAYQDGKTLITITCVRDGHLGGTVKCTLQIFHDANEVDNLEAIFAAKGNMKQTPHAAQVYTVTFEVPREKIGKIRMFIDVVAVGKYKGKWYTKTLAKASLRYGVDLNKPSKIRRDDRAPRILHALNTAPGPSTRAATSHKLNDILEQIHEALTDNEAFRKGIASSVDGALSGRRQASTSELTRVDERLSLILTEKLLGVPYNMPGNVYGNCNVPASGGKSRLVHLNNDVFWERMRPSVDEITYPWCAECQQLTTMVNYFRGVDMYALAKANKGELGAQRASLDIAKQAKGISIEEKDKVNGKLEASLYENADHPLGPGDFFVFNREAFWATPKPGAEVDDKDKDEQGKPKTKVMTQEEIDKLKKDERAKYTFEKIPPQHPQNHPHISCILRTFKRAGNYFFQLMDTGGQLPNIEGHALFRRKMRPSEGISDGRFLTQVRPDSGATGGGAPCVGIGVFPSGHKQDLATLKDAYQKALTARPVAVARLFLFDRNSEKQDVLYATPLLRTYTDDPKQNFSPARLAWSLRNLPHRDEIGAFWAVWGPRGPLARRMIDSRTTSLYDIRTEFAAGTTASKEFNNILLSKFPYKELLGFLFLQNIVAMSSSAAEEAHAGEAAFRFPTDDDDPQFYRKFGYVEVTRINTAHNAASWLQDKRYDLNKYPWDQHVFGDKSTHKYEQQITSDEITQPVRFIPDDMQEIDVEKFAQIKGRAYHKTQKPNSIEYSNGKVTQGPLGSKGAVVAKLEGVDRKHSVQLTFAKQTIAALGSNLRLFVELEIPVIDKRYPRPNKYDKYPYFRGDFPMQPPGCPGNPTQDECPDYVAKVCPPDCQYIVKLRGLKLGPGGQVRKQGGGFSGTVPYLDGAAMTVTALASCKAQVRVEYGGNTLTTTTGTPSAPLSLAVGSNSLQITATGLNQQSDTTTLEVVREAPSSVHTLESLAVKPGKLVKTGTDDDEFDPLAQSYDLVGTIGQYISFTPKLASEVSTLEVDGELIASGQTFGRTFTTFGLHELDLKVTAQDQSSGAYRVRYRRGSGENRLAKLQVYIKWTQQKVVKQVQDDPAQQANPERETYTVEVPDDTTRVKIVAAPKHGGAKLYLNGEKMSWQAQLELDKGDVAGEPPLTENQATVALLRVVAQNGLERLYELRILRPKDEAELIEGKVDEGMLD